MQTLDRTAPGLRPPRPPRCDKRPPGNTPSGGINMSCIYAGGVYLMVIGTVVQISYNHLYARETLGTPLCDGMLTDQQDVAERVDWCQCGWVWLGGQGPGFTYDRDQGRELLLLHNYDRNDLCLRSPYQYGRKTILKISRAMTPPRRQRLTSNDDSGDNDTDVPSQQSNDTSGTTTRSMSLPRPSPTGPTIRLPPEGTPSPTSSSLQSSIDSSLNEEKLEEKLRTRNCQHAFLCYLPSTFLRVLWLSTVAT